MLYGYNSMDLSSATLMHVNVEILFESVEVFRSSKQGHNMPTCELLLKDGMQQLYSSTTVDDSLSQKKIGMESLSDFPLRFLPLTFWFKIALHPQQRQHTVDVDHQH